MAEKDEHVQRAKLAEQAERYQDMVKEMREYTRTKKCLDSEERNLLSVAYKNVVGALRNAWRVLSNSNGKAAEDYKAEIEKELNEVCNEVVNLLVDDLIPGDKPPECQVFYLKMKGDYYRYQAEVSSGCNRNDIITKSKEAYNEALNISKSEMKPTHPIRLGLALNFSVFHYEIANDPKEACCLAKEAFDDAISDLDNMETSESYKDSTLILQLLRDNLTLWKTDAPDSNDQDEQQLEQQAE
ncbi:14-3-3 protein zeta-like [Synchiropus splendidus]|uniref:14-3-3 protein zeta-like n=1 Tax=Synchiropus splendidus TaxID=270530 RepID=UPI00237DFAD2|nr:14-3-3 protein zeta-like [Synchiropus splendidus]